MMATQSASAAVEDRTPVIAQPWRPGSFALRDAWFPIAHSPSVRKQPIRRLIHSQPYFLWRESGKAMASEFHPERLEKMRYYAGELTGGSAFYPLTECYGYVWVWYGNPDNATEELIPNVPYLPRNGKKPSFQKWGELHFNSTYELGCENLLDLVHADFLHADIIGDEVNDHDEVSVYSTSETVTMVREVSGKRAPRALKIMGVPTDKVDYRGVTHVHLRSGVVILHGKFSPGFSQPLFHPIIPESSTSSRNNFTFNITDGGRIAQTVFPLVSYIIGPQDDAMMTPQNPLYLADDEVRDASTRLDAADSRYRLLMKKLVERQRGGDYSYRSDADPAADITDILGCARAK